MKYQYLHWPMLFISFADAIIFFHRGWWEVVGFLCFCGIFTWNVYAYPRDRNMQALPKMGVDVTKNGEKEARHLLFVASIGLYMFLNLGWIWRYFR